MLSPNGSTASTATPTPRFHTERTPGRRTRGGRVAKIAAAMGKPGMPWQRRAWDVSLELEADGSWAYPIVVWTVPRQAGKTTGFGPVAHERAATKSGAKCWWTAQTRQDARDSWLDMIELVQRSPLGQVADLRKSNGSEAVTYPSGGSFRPFAPTEDALHGKANELVGIDEAWAHDAAQGLALDQAILPTFTTTGGQLWIISTAGTAWSTWFLGYVERARAAVRAGRRDTIALVEYGVTDEEAAYIAEALTKYNAEPDDPAHQAARERALELVLARHPAYGHTLKLSALRQAAEGMAPGEFLRAYGNHWSTAADQVIPEHAWEAQRVARSAWQPPTPGELVLTFDVAVNGADATIGAAWRPTPTSPARVDVIDSRPGSSWVVPRLLELRDRWRVTGPIRYDGAGPNLAVADELRRKLGEEAAAPLNTRELVTACAAFLAAVLAGQLEHAGRRELDDAIASAARRNVGDGGWAYARRQSAATIAPLVAVTVAAYALDHRPPPPSSPVVVSRRPDRPGAERARARAAARARRAAARL